MSTLSGSLLLVGGGKMGSALLHGWLASGVAPSSIDIVEPNTELAEGFAPLSLANVVTDPDRLERSELPEIIVFAVKPQVVDQVLPKYQHLMGEETTALPIAAGKSIASLEAVFGTGASIIRAMPNTPAAVSRSMSVLCANPAASQHQRDLAEQMMHAIGDVAWVNDENLMHAVTAVSGSGPAYVFLLAETMAAAGEKAGLPKDLATFLARKTVEGAGALLSGSNEAADQLRRNVTSPGGTTEAALSVLRAEDGMEALMREAIAEATSRSKALA